MVLRELICQLVSPSTSYGTYYRRNHTQDYKRDKPRKRPLLFFYHLHFLLLIILCGLKVSMKTREHGHIVTKSGIRAECLSVWGSIHHNLLNFVCLYPFYLLRNSMLITVRPIFFSSPDFVVGTPVSRAIRRFILSIPKARLRENDTPGILNLFINKSFNTTNSNNKHKTSAISYGQILNYKTLQ